MAENEHRQWEGEERRRADREDDLVKAVVCAIRDEVGCSSCGVPDEVHRAQHTFLTEWIDEQRIRKERREKIKTQVFGWAIVSALGSVGTAAYHGAMWLREHLK